MFGAGNDIVVVKTLNAISFVRLSVITWLECNAETIINMIALAVIMALMVAMIVESFGTLAPVGAAIIAFLLPGTASAASKNDCYIDCTTAKQFHFDASIPPIDNPEKVKEDYGYTPTSAFDICACKDGSFVIYRVKLCGKIPAGSVVDVLYHRWIH